MRSFTKSLQDLYRHGIQCGDGGNGSFFGPGRPEQLKIFAVVFYFGNRTIPWQLLSLGKTFTHNYKGIEVWLALMWVSKYIFMIVIWIPVFFQVDRMAAQVDAMHFEPDALVQNFDVVFDRPGQWLDVLQTAANSDLPFTIESI